MHQLRLTLLQLIEEPPLVIAQLYNLLNIPETLREGGLGTAVVASGKGGGTDTAGRGGTGMLGDKGGALATRPAAGAEVEVAKPTSGVCPTAPTIPGGPLTSISPSSKLSRAA